MVDYSFDYNYEHTPTLGCSPCRKTFSKCARGGASRGCSSMSEKKISKCFHGGASRGCSSMSATQTKLTVSVRLRPIHFSMAVRSRLYYSSLTIVMLQSKCPNFCFQEIFWAISGWVMTMSTPAHLDALHVGKNFPSALMEEHRGDARP